MPGQRLSESQARHVAKIADQAKQLAGLSNGAIADKAGYTERTVRDVLRGHCRVYDTVKDVCAALGIDLDDTLARGGLNVSTDGNAPPRLGGYAKANYLDLIGRYVTVRPTYHSTSKLRYYHTDIDWDVGASCLRFKEVDRQDADCQTGDVYIPRASAFMYLLTLDKGWVRTIIVSSSRSSIMRGLILSQHHVSGNNFAPVCTPIVYIRDQGIDQDISNNEIVPSDPRYQRFASLLNETVSEGFVKFVSPTVLLT